MNKDEAKKVLEILEDAIPWGGSKNGDSICCDGWCNLKALVSNLELHYNQRYLDEVDRLKAEVQVLRDDEKDCEDCLELARMGQEINRLKEENNGLNDCNEAKDKMLKFAQTEMNELKGRVGELENTIETYIKDNDDFGGLFNHWFYRKDVANHKINELQAKLQAVREIDVERLEEIIEKFAKNQVTNYEIRTTEGEPEQRSFHSESEIKTGLLAKAIKSKIDETIGGE